MLLFESSISSEGSTDEDIDLLISEELLVGYSISVLFEETGNDIIKEEDQFILIREESLCFFLDGIYDILMIVHLSLTRLGLLRLVFLL